MCDTTFLFGSFVHHLAVIQPLHPGQNPNDMDTSELHDELSEALRLGDTARVFRCLDKSGHTELQAVIRSLIAYDRATYHQAYRLLIVPHGLCILLRLYFGELALDYPNVVSFSPTSCSCSSAVCRTKTVAALEVKVRFYMATIYLCSYAISRGVEYMQASLFSAGRYITLTVDTDIPFFSSIDAPQGIGVSMALHQIRQANGELKGECIGRDMKLFRLELTVEVK